MAPRHPASRASPTRPFHGPERRRLHGRGGLGVYIIAAKLGGVERFYVTLVPVAIMIGYALLICLAQKPAAARRPGGRQSLLHGVSVHPHEPRRFALSILSDACGRGDRPEFRHRDRLDDHRHRAAGDLQPDAPRSGRGRADHAAGAGRRGAPGPARARQHGRRVRLFPAHRPAGRRRLLPRCCRRSSTRSSANCQGTWRTSPPSSRPRWRRRHASRVTRLAELAKSIAATLAAERRSSSARRQIVWRSGCRQRRSSSTRSSPSRTRSRSPEPADQGGPRAIDRNALAFAVERRRNLRASAATVKEAVEAIEQCVGRGDRSVHRGRTGEIKRTVSRCCTGADFMRTGRSHHDDLHGRSDQIGHGNDDPDGRACARRCSQLRPGRRPWWPRRTRLARSVEDARVRRPPLQREHVD